MKKFEAPMMMMIRLPQEEVITTSGTCSQNICNGYDCPDCPTQCEGVYHCNVFKCKTY